MFRPLRWPPMQWVVIGFYAGLYLVISSHNHQDTIKLDPPPPIKSYPANSAEESFLPEQMHFFRNVSIFDGITISGGFCADLHVVINTPWPRHHHTPSLRQNHTRSDPTNHKTLPCFHPAYGWAFANPFPRLLWRWCREAAGEVQNNIEMNSDTQLAIIEKAFYEDCHSKWNDVW